MRVLVVTVVHHPEDARILHRQIGTLLDEGVEVVYLAPTDRPSSLERPGLEVRPVPRAVGRRRIRALRVVGRLLEEESATVDLTVLHDPELTLLRHRISGPALWDVHEDLPAQVSDKAWIPGLLSGPARVLARRLERRAAGRVSLTLAEDSYRQRLGDHPVIRNTPEFPLDVTPWAGPGEADRVVYLSRASRGRGAEFLAEVASRLSPAIGMDVVGPVDDDVRSVLEASPATVHGFVPNPEALSIALVDAATRFKYNGTAVKDILLSERYLKLVAGEGGNEAEESANFRVALQAKVDGLEEDNRRLEQNLKDVHRKLDMVLSKLGK